MTERQHIGVLCAGHPAQRQMAQQAAAAVLTTLATMGHRATALYVDRDLDLLLRQTRIDVAFLATGGRYGGDGCVQGMLETMGIPYTGSSLLACSLASNRAKAKETLRLYNLPVAPAYVLTEEGRDQMREVHSTFGFPVMVRPLGSGSGFATQPLIAHDDLELEQAALEASRTHDDVLVERSIEGHRMAVAVLDGLALGFGDIDTGRATAESSFAAQLSSVRRHSLLRLGALSSEALGCEGAVLVELVVSERANEVVVDVDPAPMLAPSALFPRIAKRAGLSFAEVCEDLLQGARLRAHGHRRNRRAANVGFLGAERRAGLESLAH